MATATKRRKTAPRAKGKTAARAKAKTTRSAKSKSTTKKSTTRKPSRAQTARKSSGGRGITPKGMKTSSRSAPKKTRKPGKSSGSQNGEVTIDHDEIREWAESRRGIPATVEGTQRGSEGVGMLRIDFPGYSGEQSLVPIDWDEFFEKFEESNLAFLYDPDKGSKFNKLIAREGSPRKRKR